MTRPPAMTSDDITVHVEWLARRLTQQQEDTAQRRVSNHRVSGVPDHLRLFGLRDAYTPGLVSIGPLHYGDTRLLPGYGMKMAYLNSLISRGHQDASTHLAVIQEYVRLVAAREREARAMYSAENVNGFSAEDFIQMMVLDGCFVIEHLVNVAVGHEEPSLHGTPFGPTQLAVDLILFENQLPFFVLVDLMKHTRLPEFETTGYDPPILLMKLLLYYLAGDKGRDMSDALPSADGVSHILHLLHATITVARTRWVPPPRAIQARVMWMAKEAARMLQLLPLLVAAMFLYPTVPEQCRWSSRYGPVDVPSASDMRWLRMRLHKEEYGNKDGAGITSVLGPVPLEVRLDEVQGKLQLPKLRIEFRTAPLLLNLMAFEQSAEQEAGDVSAYVWFMAKLVESPEDAAVLAAAGVVQKSMVGSGSNEDVARFFRQVGSASEAAGMLERSYLRETLVALKKSTMSPLLTKRADVHRYYIDVPWRLIAAFVTVVTTVTAVLQTVAAFNQKP